MRIDAFMSNPNTSQKFNNSKNVSGKSFSQNLEDTYKISTKDSLEKSLNRIKDMGDILTATQSYSDIIEYKKMISKFLSDVLERAYSLEKKDSFWEKSYFSTVETIDKKLELMTKEILEGHKNNISIASSIDEIQGLLLDVYR